MCYVPARFVTDDFSLGAVDVCRGPLGPSRKGVRSRWDEHNSPDLRGPFFFSQFISSRITRLSLTSEEGEDHTRASATLCFTNEPCSLRLLAFALLPFEMAATWCYSTLVVFFRRSRAPGWCAVCVSLGSVSVLRTCLKLKWQQTWHIYTGLCDLWMQRFRLRPQLRGTL